MTAPSASSFVAQSTMQANRRADTRPEVRLRAALHALGLRHRIDHLVRTPASVNVKVDVVFTRARVAVFVDGCFWHACPEHGVVPRANAHYWEPKLARTRTRDREVTAALEAGGWTVVRLWEHEPLAEAIGRVQAAVAVARRPME